MSTCDLKTYGLRKNYNIYESNKTHYEKINREPQHLLKNAFVSLRDINEFGFWPLK